MRIAEIFGYGVDNHSEAAWDTRNTKHCPFRDSPCTKSSKSDPIGICSLTEGDAAAATCPVRFLEDNRIFTDAAKIAFGENVSFGVFPEIRILRIAGKDGARDRKIGKVDYILGRIEQDKITDFAAVEVQAVYFSGEEIRSPMNYFLENKKLDLENSDRRPDFRSSAQKRLMPQLQLKVPVFRRWGKKFFVVVDSQFFAELPEFRHTTPENTEITWLSYPISRQGHGGYKLSQPETIYSEWDDVMNSLREGTPPAPLEIINELQSKLTGSASKNLKLLNT
jgi:hypothetical protein